MFIWFPFILLIVIPLIIALLILLYRSLYNRHVNHALHGEEGNSRFIEPFNFMVILLLVVITIFSILTYSNLKQENRNLVSSINSLNNNLNSRINSLSSRISGLENKINELEEAKKWITNASYNYDLKMIDNNQNLNATINFSFRSLDKDSQIALLIIDKDDVNQFQKINLEYKESLSYSQQVILSIAKNYLIEVISEKGTFVEKEKISEINFKDMYSKRLYYKADGLKLKSDNKFTINLYNGHGDIEGLKLAKVSYQLYLGNILKETKDITSNINSDWENNTYTGQVNFQFSEEISIIVIVEDKFGNVINLGRQYI